jgi:hypothetical protein
MDKHRTAINTLSDDVLLEIFDFCQIDSNNHLAFTCPGSDWLRQVHICQRWRRIVLVSPRRLDLTLFCTYGTPVRKNIGFLPPLPIILDYLTPSSLRSSAPNYEDDIIAALDHPSRVRSIKLVVTNSLLEMVALVMQEPFPALTTLWLSSKDRNAPVLPDVIPTHSCRKSSLKASPSRHCTFFHQQVTSLIFNLDLFPRVVIFHRRCWSRPWLLYTGWRSCTFGSKRRHRTTMI